MAQKFYVVWSGRQTGIFTDWATTQRAVDKFAGARFKSFATRAEAEQALSRGGYASIPPKTASRHNGVLFALYHLHMPWAIPANLVDIFALAYPSRRYRSALIGIIVHSSQGVFVLVLLLYLVLR